MSRISINLLPDECEVLIALSERERRTLRDQAAVIIRETLIERGLLLSAPPPDLPTSSTTSTHQAASHD